MKKTKSTQKQFQPTQSKVKWVKKANQWCKTEWKDGRQVITWHSVRPDDKI